MKHPSTRQLFEYWNEQRGLRAAPERSEIEPGAIRRALADTFILAFDGRAGHPFRIAGTRICAAFSHELKNESFLDLWRPEDRALIDELLAAVAHESIGVVASAHAESTNGKIDFELVVLPLKHRTGSDGRLLGALAPLDMPYWFGLSALGPLVAGTHRYLTPGQTEGLPRFAPTPGRPARGFRVYDGGRS